jgi:hypothetical protein
MEARNINCGVDAVSNMFLNNTTTMDAATLAYQCRLLLLFFGFILHFLYLIQNMRIRLWTLVASPFPATLRLHNVGIFGR